MSDFKPGDRVTVEGIAQRGKVGLWIRFPGSSGCAGAFEQLNLSAIDPSAVRLVKAAAPSYEAGRIYRSDHTGDRWLFVGEAAGGTHPWLYLDAPADARRWYTLDEVPSGGLTPCDVVPSGEA